MVCVTVSEASRYRIEWTAKNHDAISRVGERESKTKHLYEKCKCEYSPMCESAG
jgi:hypothetical protein